MTTERLKQNFGWPDQLDIWELLDRFLLFTLPPQVRISRPLLVTLTFSYITWSQVEQFTPLVGRRPVACSRLPPFEQITPCAHPDPPFDLQFLQFLAHATSPTYRITSRGLGLPPLVAASLPPSPFYHPAPLCLLHAPTRRPHRK